MKDKNIIIEGTGCGVGTGMGISNEGAGSGISNEGVSGISAGADETTLITGAGCGIKGDETVV